MTVEERFWSKVDRDGSSGCWLWTGAIKGGGYGSLSVESSTVNAHRWSYEHFVGPIPSGMQLDHLCRVRRCVNPAHLEVVTNEENARRGAGNGGELWDGSHYRRERTHCLRGHPFDEENAYVDTRGCRKCRTCNREQQQRRRREARGGGQP